MLEMFNVLASNTTLCAGIEIPNTLFNIVSLIIKCIKIAVPILLIIWGMLDFAKSVIAKKEDDIKQYRKNFIARLISALLVFLVITIVELAVSLLNGVDKQSNVEGQNDDIWACCQKFIEGVDKNSTNTSS